VRGSKRAFGIGGKGCRSDPTGACGTDVHSSVVEKAEQVRPYFGRLRELRDELTGKLGIALPVLSMGMSHDFEVAIEEGATEVRVGTALFGTRDIK